MASPTPGAEPTSTEDGGNPHAALSHALAMIKAKNDTSRFVGLSGLRLILDHHKDLAADPKVIQECWDAISVKFLIRLLRSSPNATRTAEDSASMLSLAIAVIYTFMILLPPEGLEEDKAVDACLGLVSALPRCSGDELEHAMRSLVTVAAHPRGASAFLQLPANKLQSFVDCIGKTGLAPTLIEILMKTSLDTTVSSWGDNNQSEDAWTWLLLRYSEHFLSKGKENQDSLIHSLDQMALAMMNNPRRLEVIAEAHLLALTKSVRKMFVSAPFPNICVAVTKLFHWILLSRRDFSPFILEDAAEGSEEGPKSFGYLFMNSVLISIRTTIPSLMEQLASSNYQSVVAQLAAEYDISTKFLIDLMKAVDILENEADAVLESSAFLILEIKPDYLLKLKAQIVETLSLTCEYTRDRWDATIGGAPGLHAEARVDQKQPLPITWDSPDISMFGDPAIVAGLRMLATYIQDDPEEQLVKESCDILDVLLSLYANNQEPESRAVDFKNAVLVLLEVLMTQESGAKLFHEQDGFLTLMRELRKEYLLESDGEEFIHDSAVNIPRVLNAFVRSEYVAQTKERWIEDVSQISLKTYKVGRSVKTNLYLTGCVNLFQLYLALYDKAPKRIQTSHRSKLRELEKLIDIIAERDGECMEGNIKTDLLDIKEELHTI